MVACNIFRTNTNAVQEKKEIDLCIDSTILGLSSVLLQKVGDFISHTDSDGYKKWPVIMFYFAPQRERYNVTIASRLQIVLRIRSSLLRDIAGIKAK